MSEWISVDDKVPSNHGYYLVAGHNNTQFISLYSRGRWLRQTASKSLSGVTHWMPLPEPPKKQGG